VLFRCVFSSLIYYNGLMKEINFSLKHDRISYKIKNYNIQNVNSQIFASG
jgi:hypothetical protein